MSKSVASWRALIVDEVNEDKLLNSVGTDSDLPLKPVSISKDLDLSQVAVLSWRWDGKYRVWGSYNVASAILHARESGIRYLFIDAISIDQTLPGPQLLDEVTSFSKLYTTIPVIAAYDQPGQDFKTTMRRPWILSEARSFKSNPTRILYVGHADQGTQRQRSFRNASFAMLKEHQQTAFAQMLNEIWRTSFTQTILGVLCGGIGMCSIADFRFIIPDFAGILSVAYEVLSRNDYLLTVAILCQACTGYLEAMGTRGEGDVSLVGFGEMMQWGRYRFSPEWKVGLDWCQHILLDGRKIAAIHTVMRGSHAERFSLEALDGAERVIFDALALPESEWEAYTAQAESRNKNLRVTLSGDSLLPQVDIHSVALRLSA